jgi:hypothetical protein
VPKRFQLQLERDYGNWGDYNADHPNQRFNRLPGARRRGMWLFQYLANDARTILHGYDGSGVYKVRKSPYTGFTVIFNLLNSKPIRKSTMLKRYLRAKAKEGRNNGYGYYLSRGRAVKAFAEFLDATETDLRAELRKIARYRKQFRIEPKR